MGKFLLTLLVMGLPILASSQQISSGEYFIGSDPGEGNGIALTLSDGSGDMLVEKLETSLSTESLEEGPHILSIRFKTDDESWTQPFQTVFVVKKPVSVPTDPGIIAGEYFLGSDPGEGFGTALSFTDGTGSDPVEELTGELTTDLLPGEPVILSFRAKSDMGTWLKPVQTVLSVQQAKTTGFLPSLTAAEYFIDSDPGVGAANALTFSDGNSGNLLEGLAASIETGEMESGKGLVGIRLREGTENWSSPVLLSFFVTEFAPIQSASRPAPISNAEMFAGSDPGEGSGTSLDIPEPVQGGTIAVGSGSLIVPDSDDPAIPVSIRFQVSEETWTDPVRLPAPLFYPTADILISSESILAADSLRQVLNQEGLLFNEWDRIDGSSPSLSGWKTVIWDEKDFLTTDQRDSIESFLSESNDPTLIIAGEDIAEYHDQSMLLADSTFLRQHLHASLINTDAGSGSFGLLGSGIHDLVQDTASISDPDVIRPRYGATSQIIWQSLTKPDSALAIAYDGLSNIYYSSIRWNSITTGLGSHLNRILQWVESSGGSLPVELTTVTGTWSGRSIRLNWETATETNNAGFSIWRKNKQNAWEQRGFVNGAGTSNAAVSYSFSDSDALEPVLTYQLRQVDTDGSVQIAGTVEVTRPVASEFILHRNYPNPFNPSTAIPVEIPESGMISLKVINMLGQEVYRSETVHHEPGLTQMRWNGRGTNGTPAATGKYWYLVIFHSDSGKEQVLRGSMTLLK